MQSRPDSTSALAAVDERRILELEQQSIKIPSSTFEEGKIADLYANTMTEIGLDVEMMDVVHPSDPTKKSSRPARSMSLSLDAPSRTYRMREEFVPHCSDSCAPRCSGNNAPVVRLM